MPSFDAQIDARIGDGRFDTCFSLPEAGSGPCVIPTASVYGVDDDARAIEIIEGPRTPDRKLVDAAQ